MRVSTESVSCRDFCLSDREANSCAAVTLHQRYIYREYLQIVCVDLTRPTATRPLAIQKDGSWFTYGHDVTRAMFRKGIWNFRFC